MTDLPPKLAGWATDDLATHRYCRPYPGNSSGPCSFEESTPLLSLLAPILQCKCLEQVVLRVVLSLKFVMNIESSTQIWETLPEHVCDEVISLHHEVIRKQLHTHHGYECGTEKLSTAPVAQCTSRGVCLKQDSCRWVCITWRMPQAQSCCCACASRGVCLRHSPVAVGVHHVAHASVLFQVCLAPGVRVPAYMHQKCACLCTCTESARACEHAPKVRVPVNMHQKYECLCTCTESALAYVHAPKVRVPVNMHQKCACL
eukprot:1161025-Pelagomonas_calceolata.AAC.11